MYHEKRYNHVKEYQDLVTLAFAIHYFFTDWIRISVRSLT